jgi:hypothetical protein
LADQLLGGADPVRNVYGDSIWFVSPFHAALKQ